MDTGTCVGTISSSTGVTVANISVRGAGNLQIDAGRALANVTISDSSFEKMFSSSLLIAVPWGKSLRNSSDKTKGVDKLSSTAPSREAAATAVSICKINSTATSGDVRLSNVRVNGQSGPTVPAVLVNAGVVEIDRLSLSRISGGDRGLVVYSGVRGELRDSVISACSAGAIALRSGGGRFLFANVSLVNNTANYGAGVFYDSSTGLRCDSQTQFTNNSAAIAGGEIFFAKLPPNDEWASCVRAAEEERNKAPVRNSFFLCFLFGRK